MNAWNFIFGVIAGGIVSVISVIVGAAISTTANTGKKLDKEATRYYNEEKT